MQKSPSPLLILFVIGVPAVLTLAVLWPQIQNGLQGAHNEDTPAQPIAQIGEDSSPPDKETDQVVVQDDIYQHDVEQGDAVPDDAAQEVMTPTSIEQPSAVEKQVAVNREQFTLAKASYDRVAQSTSSELLQQFGAEQWSEIQSLVTLAERLPEPLRAAENYRKAESLLRELSTDLPTRKLLSDMAELKSQQQHLPFLTKLTSASDSQPAIRDRLAPFWSEVSNWTTETWLTVIRRESEDLSPDDGGFADVYHALADFHRQSESEQAALEAEQTAWENALRMTNPTRAAQSAIRSLQRLSDSTPFSTRADRIEEVTTLVRDVTEIHDRMELLAKLANQSPQSNTKAVLDEIQNLAVSSRIDLRLYWPAIYRCKVLAETSPPSAILDLCVSIPKYNGRIGFDPFAANTMAYAHAASAAARTNDRSAFWKAMLLAEAQQLDSTGVEIRDQKACGVLASADIRQKNFRRVMYSAMNLRERRLRPPLIFPVMKESPQDVPQAIATRLIQQHGTDDLGCVAVASYASTLVESFESEPEAISWILGLNSRSVRIASLIGFARHRANPQAVVQQNRIQQPSVDPTDARSLLEIAETEAALLQLPLDRAWAYLWIAACWNKLDQPASYVNALKEVDDAMYAAWKSHWRNSDGDDRPSSYRSNKERNHELNRFIDCYCSAAELQAFVLSDPHRAIENVINAARTSQPLNDGNGNLKIRLWLITESIHRECGIPPGTLDSVFLPPNNYYRMLLAARNRDLSSLKSAVQAIETQGIGKGFEAPDYLARAYAELALLCATNGDLAEYRSARRKSAGIITSKGTVDSIFLPLYEADAFAGEFTLAMSRNRRLDSLSLYGTSGRTDSALCTQLSVASRTQDAIKHLPSVSEPFYRLQAMHAVAASRSVTTSSDQLVRWQDEQPEQLDRIAILCGLACKKPIP